MARQASELSRTERKRLEFLLKRVREAQEKLDKAKEERDEFFQTSAHGARVLSDACGGKPSVARISQIQREIG